MVTSIKVKELNSKVTAEILDMINTLKVAQKADREIDLVFESTKGDYNNAIKIVDSVLRNEVKVNATCEGSLDASAAILSSLAKCTQGTSTAFFSADFQISQKIKSGKRVDSPGENVRDNAVKQVLEHLKCRKAILVKIFDTGELVSAPLAKRCGFITEVIKLPKIEMGTKKTGKIKAVKSEVIDPTAAAENVALRDSSVTQDTSLVESSESDKE